MYDHMNGPYGHQVKELRKSEVASALREIELERE